MPETWKPAENSVTTTPPNPTEAEELEQLQVKLAAALVVAETQAEELAEARRIQRVTEDLRQEALSRAKIQAEELATLRARAENTQRLIDRFETSMKTQAEELERLRVDLTHEVGFRERAEAQLTKQAAVIEAAKELVGQAEADEAYVTADALDGLIVALDALTTDAKHEMYVGGTWVTVADRGPTTQGDQEP